MGRPALTRPRISVEEMSRASIVDQEYPETGKEVVSDGAGLRRSP